MQIMGWFGVVRALNVMGNATIRYSAFDVLFDFNMCLSSTVFEIHVICTASVDSVISRMSVLDDVYVSDHKPVSCSIDSVSYTHLTLPTTPYV